MERREFITLAGAAAAWPILARAQQPKIPHIGVLSLGRGDGSDASVATLDAFMSALRELGYTNG
jgi:putative ABC transport system substrate-binding protein